MVKSRRIIVQEFTKGNGKRKLKSHKYYRIFEDAWDF